MIPAWLHDLAIAYLALGALSAGIVAANGARALGRL